MMPGRSRPSRPGAFKAGGSVKDLAWADSDNDGDLDLAVMSAGPSQLYRNDGEQLQSQPIWASADEGGSSAVAWGDVDGDGDLDLASDDPSADKLQLYRSSAADLSRPAARAPRVSVGLPAGSAASSSPYAVARIAASSVVSVPFTLRDADDDAVRRVRAEFSLDGGGNWRPAVPASWATLTNLGASATGKSYSFPWDLFRSGVFGLADNVLVRITVYPGSEAAARRAPLFQHGAFAAQAAAFRVRGTQVRVVDEQSQPVRAVLVYRLPAGQRGDAQPISSAIGVVYRTNFSGYLSGRGALSPGDGLVALATIAGPANPKFTRYLTSAAVGAGGLAPFTVSRPGVQTLRIARSNPLLAINLSISLEWDARNDLAYLEQLKSDLLRRSELLYIWSDGQIALGDVTIAHDKQGWADADVQIYAANSLRPNANQGGISAVARVDPDKPAIVYEPGQIRMGAVWNRFGEAAGQPGEDWPRAFAHELGHWALFLDEDYLGLDASRRLISVEGCKSPMADPYRADYAQFRADSPAACAPTLNQQVGGRDNWATIKRFYDTAG
jgi:hypothetical protein